MNCGPTGRGGRMSCGPAKRGPRGRGGMMGAGPMGAGMMGAGPMGMERAIFQLSDGEEVERRIIVKKIVDGDEIAMEIEEEE